MEKSKVKKIALGVLIVIVALFTLLIAFFDGDPDTKPDVKGTIEKVKEGVEMIKDAKEESTEESAPSPEATDDNSMNYKIDSDSFVINPEAVARSGPQSALSEGNGIVDGRTIHEGDYTSHKVTLRSLFGCYPPKRS